MPNAVTRIAAVLFVVLATSLLFGATSASAQQSSRFDDDDKNKDGKISREEFSGQKQGFDRMDRNRDGFLTREEVPASQTGNRNRFAGPEPPEGVELLADIEYGKGGGEPLLLDIIRPEKPAKTPMPVLVFIHGGAWRAGDKRSARATLFAYAQDGYFCATINYRLTDKGQHPIQTQDCKCAIRYLRAHAEKYGLDPDRVGVWGSSAGGHLVAMLGVTGGVEALEGDGGWAKESSRVQAVCDWFGPADLLAMTDQPSGMNHSNADSPEGMLVGGAVREHPEAARAASPITYVDKNDAPILIMHGTKDMTVPFGQSVLFHKALEKAGVSVEFHPVEGAGHGGAGFGTPESEKLVKDFFDKQLK